MEKYQHLPELRGIGFFVRIASMIFSKYIQGSSAVMKQKVIANNLGIGLPRFYRHFNFNPEKAQQQMEMLGLRRYKVGSTVYFELDTDVYKDFIFGTK